MLRTTTHTPATSNAEPAQRRGTVPAASRRPAALRGMWRSATLAAAASSATLSGWAAHAAQPSSPMLLLSDVDGDGAADSITVESGYDETAPRLGRITAVSGATGQILYTILGEAANDRFGFAVRLADLDGDGDAELLASAPNAPGAAGGGSGRVYIFSAATGQHVRTILAGDGLRIGTGLDTVADQDGDGWAELLVEGAAAGGGWQGRTFIYSGSSGELLAARKATVGGVQRAVASGGRAYLAGDLDDSGAVDAHDVALIASAIAGGGDATHDVNRDGVVDAGDLVAVVEALARGERSMAGAGVVTEVAGESAGMEARWSGAHAGDALSLSWSQVTHNAASGGAAGGEDQPLGLVEESEGGTSLPGLVPCECDGGVVSSLPGLLDCAGVLGGCPDQWVPTGTAISLSVPEGCFITITADNVQYETFGSYGIRLLSEGCISVMMTCTRDGQCCGCQVCQICAYEEVPPCEATVSFLNCPEQPVAIDALDDLVLHAAGFPRAMHVDGLLRQGGYEWAIQVSDCEELCPAYVDCPDCPEGCPVSYYAPVPSTSGGLRLADHPAFETLNPVPGQCLWVRVRYRFGDCAPHDCCQGPWDCCHAVATCKFPLYERDPALDSDGDGYCDWEEVDGQDRPLDRLIDADLDLLSRHTDVRGVTEYRRSLQGQPPWVPVPYRERFDTDGDGVQDLAEIRLGLSPELRYTTPGIPDRYTAAGLAADADQDLVYDIYEAALGLDPTVRDTDGDGIIDGIELRAGTDPTVSLRYESPDTDGDGLCDYEEVVVYGTRSNRADTDGDGLTDLFEVCAGLNPLTPHSEARVVRVMGLNGQYEFRIELGPSDAENDSDFDGLNNWMEQILGADPASRDTDGDGVEDGQEFEQGSSPTDPSDGGVAPDPEDVCWVLITVGAHHHASASCDYVPPVHDDPRGPGPALGPWSGPPGDEKQSNEWTLTIDAGTGGGAGGSVISTGSNGERVTVLKSLRRGTCYTFTRRGRRLGDHDGYYIRIIPVDYYNRAPGMRPPICSTCCCMAIDDPHGVFGNACCIPTPQDECNLNETRVATVCLPVIDLQIDAKNDSGFDVPTEDEVDESATPIGKLVRVDRFDADGDGVPDFADGIGIEEGTPEPGTGVRFVPVRLRIVGVPKPEEATVQFTYSSSPPRDIVVTTAGTTECPKTVYAPAAGRFRLWRKDGSVVRNPSSNIATTGADPNGAFVASNTSYLLSDLLQGGTTETVLYLEAVRPSPLVGSDQLSVAVTTAPGVQVKPASCMSDSVVMTAFDAAIEAMEFDTDGLTVRKDENINASYNALHWLDNNVDGDAEDVGDRMWPVVYRASTDTTDRPIKLAFAQIYVRPSGLVASLVRPDEAIMLRGQAVAGGETYHFVANGIVSGDLITASAIESTTGGDGQTPAYLPNTVRSYATRDSCTKAVSPGFKINWMLEFGGTSVGQVSAGESQNALYVVVDENYSDSQWTVVDLSCSSSTGVSAAQRPTLIASVFSGFQDLVVHRADGAQLCYWLGYPTNEPEQGIIDALRAAALPGTPRRVPVACTGFAELFRETLLVQGVPADAHGIQSPNTYCTTNETVDGSGNVIDTTQTWYREAIHVKQWTFPVAGTPWTSPCSNHVFTCRQPELVGAPVPAQGMPAGAPESAFGIHAIVVADGRLYDPSYAIPSNGADAPTSLAAYEDLAIDGFSGNTGRRRVLGGPWTELPIGARPQTIGVQDLVWR